MTAPLLDTHAWIWWMNHDRRLGPAAPELDALPEDDRPRLADISVWEAALLWQRGRLQLALPLRDWLDTATDPRAVTLVPILPAVAGELAGLPKAFHKDPADRLIVATSRALGAPLLTYDRRIRRSRLVELWRPRDQRTS